VFLASRGCEALLEKETAGEIGSQGLDYAAIAPPPISQW